MSVENGIKFKKDNELIRSLGNPSNLANKVLYAALVHVEMADPKNPSPILSKADWERVSRELNADYTRGLVSIFSQNEIRLLANKGNSGSYYNGIRKLLNSNPNSKTEGLQSFKNQMTMVSSSKGVHETVSLVTACAFDEKTKNIFIKFSDEEKIQKKIYNLKKNYTLLPYDVMMQFRSNYASKLYEILKSRIDYEESKSNTIKNRYEFKYNIAHLKYLLGVLDPFNNKETISLITQNNPDFDLVEGFDKTGKMPNWTDFKRYCLVPCQKDINNLTEYNLDFEKGERKGRGGKVFDVTLIVERKVEIVGESALKDDTPSTDDLFDLIDKAREIIIEKIPQKLSTAEIKILLDESNNDVEKIKKACQVANESKKVDDYMRFLRSAIKKDWDPNKRGRKATENRFNNFEQNKYDFEALEEQLLDN